MSRERLREVILRHIEAETARDIDAILASLHPDPHWIIPGFDVRGQEALRALYESVMPLLTPENAAEYIRALDDPRVASWGEDHVVLIYTEDYPIHYGMIVVARLEDDMLKSEHTLFSLQHPATIVPPFAHLPGVTPIVSPRDRLA